jgi:hypothetical protein
MQGRENCLVKASLRCLIVPQLHDVGRKDAMLPATYGSYLQRSAI